MDMYWYFTITFTVLMVHIYTVLELKTFGHCDPKLHLHTYVTWVSFRWLVGGVDVQDCRLGWLASDVEFSYLKYYCVSGRFSDILCIPYSWLGVPLDKVRILLVDLEILCKKKRDDFHHIWHIWVGMRSMSVCDHSFDNFGVVVFVVFYRAPLFLLLYVK